jgi:hypothetical protein
MPEVQARPADWPRLLSQTCELLSRTPAALVPALSVRAPLDGNPATWSSVSLVAEQLARRYGLHCRSSLGRTFAEVTFSRQAAEG